MNSTWGSCDAVEEREMNEQARGVETIFKGVRLGMRNGRDPPGREESSRLGVVSRESWVGGGKEDVANGGGLLQTSTTEEAGHGQGFRFLRGQQLTTSLRL